MRRDRGVGARDDDAIDAVDISGPYGPQACILQIVSADEVIGRHHGPERTFSARDPALQACGDQLPLQTSTSISGSHHATSELRCSCAVSRCPFLWDTVDVPLRSVRLCGEGRQRQHAISDQCGAVENAEGASIAAAVATHERFVVFFSNIQSGIRQRRNDAIAQRHDTFAVERRQMPQTQALLSDNAIGICRTRIGPIDDLGTVLTRGDVVVSIVIGRFFRQNKGAG